MIPNTPRMGGTHLAFYLVSGHERFYLIKSGGGRGRAAQRPVWEPLHHLSCREELPGGGRGGGHLHCGSGSHLVQDVCADVDDLQQVGEELLHHGHQGAVTQGWPHFLLFGGCRAGLVFRGPRTPQRPGGTGCDTSTRVTPQLQGWGQTCLHGVCGHPPGQTRLGFHRTWHLPVRSLAMSPASHTPRMAVPA